MQGGAEGGVAEGSEEAEACALDALAEEPLADRAAGLLLDHEGQALGEAIVVDHGIGAGPHDSRHGEERELARLEVEGALEVDVEGRHVVGEPAQIAHRSRERARSRGARLALSQWRRDLERAIPMGHALAHEELGLALQVAAAGGVGPLAHGPAADEPRLA